MRPLLLILLVVLAAVLVFQLTREAPEPETQVETGPTEVGPKNSQLPLGKRPLPGEDPAVPPEFDVRFDVIEGVGGNQMDIHISEQHGYYVETFQLQIKKKNVDYRLEPFYDVYLKANDTLTIRERIVPAELPNFGGAMGTGADWEGVVTRYGRAREADPNPLPEIVETP